MREGEELRKLDHYLVAHEVSVVHLLGHVDGQVAVVVYLLFREKAHEVGMVSVVSVDQLHGAVVVCRVHLRGVLGTVYEDRCLVP